MRIFKIELLNENVAWIVGTELSRLDVNNYVIGGAVVCELNCNMNCIVDVCQLYGGFMNYTTDYDLNLLTNK
jgi:hypothetical protein